MKPNRILSHSQNFFKNPNTVKEFVDLANITKSDIVVEIGPGKGAITKALLEKAKQVIAIEIDTKLYHILKDNFSQYKNLKLIQGDFLKWEPRLNSYLIFANIPFNTTADIIKKITFNPTQSPDRTYLFTQKQAAEKYTNKQIGGKHNLQSILLFSDYSIEIIKAVPRHAFTPTPKVPIVLLEITKRPRPLIDPGSRQLFRDFVVYGFNQWQPTVLDSFRKVFSNTQLSKIAKQINIINAKPKDLTFQQWAEWFSIFEKLVTSPAKIKLIKDSEKKLFKQQEKLTKRHRTTTQRR